MDHTLSDREKLSVRWRQFRSHYRGVQRRVRGEFELEPLPQRLCPAGRQRAREPHPDARRRHRQRSVDEFSVHGGSRTDSRFDYADDARCTRSLEPQRAVSRGSTTATSFFLRRPTRACPARRPSPAYNQRFPMDAADKRWVIADNVSWAKGRHLVKAGVYWESNLNSEGLGGNCFSGCFNFSSADRNNPGNTGHAFANALLGNFATYSESSRRPLLSGVTNFTEWFVQDSWKARSNLSLDLGVRFSYGGPFRLRDGEPGAGFVLERFDADAKGPHCSRRRSSAASASSSTRQRAQPCRSPTCRAGAGIERFLRRPAVATTIRFSLGGSKRTDPRGSSRHRASGGHKMHRTTCRRAM